MKDIPFHLKKYIVEQKATQYTPVEQASWRFILRQLKKHLSLHAHSFYLEGLEKTGISVEEIPSIQKISERLQAFGWLAAPVSGFIPPAAFLELQAHKILPIASDMRSLAHLMYTPAPDIVHEAAGHAPMTAHPEFREYLELYAQIAQRAIINKHDLELYNAIRELSDVKEHPNSTEKEIQKTQSRLDQASQNMGEPSEASILSRMAWWTTEYGLIGEPAKIYGAGLLSSFGESKTAIEEQTKKIPLSLECIQYSYDITEPQPQLFVAKDFSHLKDVLNQLSETMSYKKGGIFGLQKAKEAQTINTVQFNSGIQISGDLKEFLVDSNQIAIYLKFQGPCQLNFEEKELTEQGTRRHAQGYSTPVGFLVSQKKCLSEMSQKEFEKLNLIPHQKTHLQWESGVELRGICLNITKIDHKPILITFSECTVTYKGQTLYDPSWGEFDLALGTKIISVFGGAADKESFGEFTDFKAKKLPKKHYSQKELDLFDLYLKIRNLRQSFQFEKTHNVKYFETELSKVLNALKLYPEDWLLKLEILELAKQLSFSPKWMSAIEKDLIALAEQNKDMEYFIKQGIEISGQLHI